MSTLKIPRGLSLNRMVLLSLWILGGALSSSTVYADDGLMAPSRLGQPLKAADLAALTPVIFPSGKGLPAGQGTAEQGAVLYQSQCASCHGRKGEGGTAQELIGGQGPLSAPDADKTLLTYWPYATTLFDTIMRSMPPAAPGHLSADELYALCAYLLSENGLWDRRQPLAAKELAAIAMPNRNGFIRKYP